MDISDFGRANRNWLDGSQTQAEDAASVGGLSAAETSATAEEGAAAAIAQANAQPAPAPSPIIAKRKEDDTEETEDAEQQPEADGASPEGGPATQEAIETSAGETGSVADAEAVSGGSGGGSSTLVIGALAGAGLIGLGLAAGGGGSASDGPAPTPAPTPTPTPPPANRAPAAVSDTASATEDGAAATGSVAGNDSDPDGDTLAFSLNQAVAGLTLAADGTYSFDASVSAYQDLAEGETRDVVARYTVSDGRGSSASSTLTITVTGTNDAPVARADTASARAGAAAISGNLATNDSDVDGDSLRYTLDAPVAGLSVNANGTYTFDPSNAAYRNLAAGESRQVVADVTVADGNGGTATSRLTITVTGTNGAPVAVADSAAATEDGPVVTGSVATNDTDRDGDTLSYSLNAPVAGLTLNANGAYTFDPSNAAYQDLAVGETRQVVATYTASDGRGGSDTATLTITVTGTNDSPVAVADTASATEGATPITGSVATNDSDVDGDVLTYSLDAPVAGLTLNADGSYSFDPAAAAYDDLGAGETRQVVANYTVDDGNGETAGATLTITVTGTNDAPVAVADSAAANEDGAIVTGSVATNDSDVEGDVLTYALVAPVAGLTLDSAGNYSFDPSDPAYQDLPAGETRDVAASYTVSDGNGGSATATLTITVSGANDAPVTVADSYSTDEDTALVIAAPGVLANDTDIEGDSLAAILVTGPANGTLALNPDGSFTYTPDANFSGTDSFTYRANDGTANGNPATVAITVGAVNDDPVANPDTASATEDGAIVTGSLAANDTDAENDTLNYTLNAPLAGLTVAANGGYSFDPSNAAYQDLAVGETRLVVANYTVSDGNGGSATSTLSITVTGTNDDPVAVADSAGVAEDASIAGTVATNDSDVDGDTLTYTLDAPVAGLTLATNGSYGFDASNPEYQALGQGETRDVVASYTVSDGNGGTDTATLTITVTGTNDAPVAIADSGSTDDESTATGNVLANDTDAEGDALTVTAVNGQAAGVGQQITLASGALLTLGADGNYSYDPNGQFAPAAGTTATDTFSYTVGDGGLTDTATVTITIAPSNVAPVGVADAYSGITGNTPVTYAAAAGVLANDTDVDGDTLAVTQVNGTAIAGGPVAITGGTIAMNADGGFTFTPTAGYTGSTSFQYTVSDGNGGTSTATASLTVEGLVWYIDSSAAAGGDGSYLNPFNSFAPVNGVTGDGTTGDDVDGAGDTIFVYNRGTTYSSTDDPLLVLEDGQSLIGDGYDFTVNGLDIGGSIDNASLRSQVFIDEFASTTTIVLSTDNTIRGVDVTAVGELGGATAIAGMNVGSLTISDVSLSAGGFGSRQAISVNGGDLDVVVDNTAGDIVLANTSGSFVSVAGSGGRLAIGDQSGAVANSGGSADITIGSTVSFVNIQDRAGGTVDVNGNVTGSIIAAENAGTINFDGQVTINSGAATAIALTDNTGAINFNPAGNGLDITTTSGTGFLATGGGTVTLTGSGNSISTQTGSAIYINGTAIGAAGMTFERVDVTTGDANTGIFLANTGVGGAFAITGTGSTAGSGGTINGIESGGNALTNQGNGIYLLNTGNVSLANMSFTGDFANYGIFGQNVSDFTLRDTVMNSASADDGGFGNSAGEGAIRFANLTGTAVFEGNNISDGHTNNLWVANTAGTLDLFVRDSSSNGGVIGRNGTASGAEGLLIEAGGTAAITSVVDGVTFTGTRGSMLESVTTGTGSQALTVSNSTFINGHPDSLAGTNGIAVLGSGGTGAGFDIAYTLSNNTVRGAEGTAILVSGTGAAGSVDGVIIGNTIGTGNGGYDAIQSNTGSMGGDGIAVVLEKSSGAGSLTGATRIENNIVGDIAFGSGIFVGANGPSDGSGSTRLEATIRNNVIGELGQNALAGIYALVGGAGSGDNGLLGLDITANAINLNGADFSFAGIALDDLSNAGQFYFPGYAGPYDDASLEAYLTGPKGNTILTAGTFADPVVTLPTGTFASGSPFVLPVPLRAVGADLADGTGVVVGQAEVDMVRDAAIARWVASGASADQVAAMQATSITVADLPADYLGQTTPAGIVIDTNAAGKGWFVDATPGDDTEFDGTGAVAGAASGTGYDLLTVVMHELGHVAGLDDLYAAGSAGELMFGFLAPGTRYLPGDGASPTGGSDGSVTGEGQAAAEASALSLAGLSLVGLFGPEAQSGDAGQAMDDLLGGFAGSAGMVAPLDPGAIDTPGAGFALDVHKPWLDTNDSAFADARVL